jgi:hypothetical protein
MRCSMPAPLCHQTTKTQFNIMNKIAVFIAIFCISAGSLFAQELPRFTAYYHKPIGNAPMEAQLGKFNSDTDDGWNGFLLVIDIFAGTNFSDEPNYDYVTAQELTDKRSHSLGFRAGLFESKRLQIGLNFTRFEYDMKKRWMSGFETKDTERFSSLNTDMQYTWLSRKHLACYSGMGMGLVRHNYDNPRTAQAYSDSRLAAQVNFLGVRTNFGAVGAQVEFRYGVSSLVQAGIVVGLK